MNNISKEILYHQNPEEIINHTCDDNGINLLNIEEELDVTSINYSNTSNYIFINDDYNFIHKEYAPFVL